MKNVPPVGLVILSLLGGLRSQAAPQVLIDHVNVVDFRTATIHSNQNILIRGERIEAMGQFTAPRGVRRIDGRGRYLIPGLWDMHVHLGLIERESLDIYIASGVLGVREMGSSVTEFRRMRAYRQEVAAGRMVGVDVVGTVEGIERPGIGGPQPIGLENEFDVRSAVNRLLELGADFVTVGGDLPRPSYLSLAGECRRIVPRDMTPAEVSDAGQCSIEHMDGLLLACSRLEPQIRASLKEGRPVSIQTVLDTFDQKKAQDLAVRFRKNGTWLCPTLMEQRFPAEAGDPALYRDPRLRYVPEKYLREWDVRRQAVRDTEVARKLFEANLRLTGLMWRNGVRILAGTDTPWPYCIPGLSLHDELRLLVRAGLSAAAALEAATLGPAEFLTGTPGAGAIVPGARADLLLLDGNPLAEVDNAERIHTVVIRGHVLARRELDRMLKRVAHDAGSSK